MTTKTLTPSTDLKNTKRVGLGWEMLDSTAGAFVVLEECSHSAPYEIGRFDHDGSAKSRANAFRDAQTLAGSRDKYDGQGLSFNTYEEEAEPVAPLARCVSSLNDEEARTVAATARLVRQDIRRKAASLKALRAIKNDNVIVNPYFADRRNRRITPELWNMIRNCIGSRVEVTCTALLDLEIRADRRGIELANTATINAVAADMNVARANVKAAAEGYAVGDAVDDNGTKRTVTAIRESGVLVLDGCIETTGASVKRIRGRHESANQEAAEDIALVPAANIYRLTYPEIVERMKIERAQPAGTKPTARAFLALMVSRDQSRLSPDRDTVRDILQSHLVNCYQHGVLDPREFVQADELARTAERPRALLEALRAALLSGADIIEALKAAE